MFFESIKEKRRNESNYILYVNNHVSFKLGYQCFLSPKILSGRCFFPLTLTYISIIRSTNIESTLY